MTTTDEALRVAIEALERAESAMNYTQATVSPGNQRDRKGAWVEVHGGWAGSSYRQLQLAIGATRSALRTIALAVGAPSDGVEVDRDSDGELLIDWFPSPGRMLTMSLRHDGRLSYAFRWEDGEQAHGTAQMPPAVQSVALGEPNSNAAVRAPFHPNLTGLAAALRSQRQVDEDGTEVGVSRQAADEAATIIEALAADPASASGAPEAHGTQFRVDKDGTLRFADGSCRPATEPEKAMWRMLMEQPAASGAVGETAEPNASQLIDDLEWAVLARSQGVPGSADRLHDAKQAIRNALAAVPGTSNGQENGNGR